MTFADVLRRRGSTPEVPWHLHDASDISGRGDFLELKVDRLLGGTILGEEIILSGADSILRSSNFVSGSAGWRILGDGSAEFSDVVIRSDLYSTNWDGAIPANLTSVDLVATAGWYWDTSVGSAQLMGNLFLAGGGKLHVDIAAGQDIQVGDNVGPDS